MSQVQPITRILRELFQFLFVLLFFVCASVAEEPEATLLPEDLTTVGLESLLNFDLNMTLAGRHEERLSHAASAAFILSQEDIRRSGARHIVDVLRLIPGVNVGQASSNKYAVSIRGFNQIFANKLLVLVDGVSVFSPTTNGVYWESSEFILEDIERIEVIRGPGAALWGDNAVNGVINIVTKDAKDTKGTYVSAGGGTHERHFYSVRQGVELSENTHARVYGTFSGRAQNRFREGGHAEDDWLSNAAGFRMNSSPTERDKVTAITDIQYQEDTLSPTVPSLSPPFADDESFRDDTSWFGVRSQLQWQHTFDSGSSSNTQFSYSRKERDSLLSSFHYDQINLDSQYRTKVSKNHTVVGGARYRYLRNSADSSAAQEVDPNKRDVNLITAFVHDDITVTDSLRFILGTKVGHNDFTGFEFMPNARSIYQVNNSISIWSAVSRAVAPPAIFFEDSRIPVAAFPDASTGGTNLLNVTGSRNLESEDLLAYELGLRGDLSSKVSFDLAGFYNDYDDIFSTETGTPNFEISPLGGPVVNIPLLFDNQLSAEAYGGELALEYRPYDVFRVVATYSYLQIHVDTDGSSDTTSKPLIEDASAENQVSLRGHLDITDSVEFDLIGRYVDSLGFGNVPAYVEMDARAAWQIDSELEFSLVGRNLLDNAHQEFLSNLFGPPATEIERSVFAFLTWRI